ncbi:MAG: hypothetical protein KJ749_06090 [Planctomycetes bacterium]|nr:hypothetical protein [Planctomycetota bacterium]
MNVTEKAAWILAMGVLIAFGLGTPASAQVLTTGQSALDNVAAAGARAPGNMVSAGVARAQEAANAPRGITITEVAPTTSIRAQALAQSLGIVFDQLNQAITLFANLLLARAGGPAIVDQSTLSDLTSGTETSTGGRR